MKEQKLQDIADLAKLKIATDDAIGQDINEIIKFVSKLSKIDTTNATQLIHPLNIGARLREDHAQNIDARSMLAKCAPQFADDLYIVPKVIESEK